MKSRMEKYKAKKKHKNRKKLKFMFLILLISFFVFKLNDLDYVLKNTTNTYDKSIYSISKDENTYNIELLGNNYYIDRERIENILYSIKDNIKKLKDQIELVF